MEDQKMLAGYALWAVIVVLTIFFFDYFIKKKFSFGSLVLLVLLPTWIITALLQGIFNIYFDNLYMFSFYGFLMLCAQTIAPIILFWGVTFTVKYLKYKRKVRK